MVFDLAKDATFAEAVTNLAFGGLEEEATFAEVSLPGLGGTGGADIGAPTFAGVDGAGDVVGVAAQGEGSVDRSIHGGVSDADEDHDDGDIGEALEEDVAALVGEDVRSG